VSVLKIDEDTENYNKDVAGEDWRKLISIAVKNFQIFKISGFCCGAVDIALL
jgi:hypothetical protein